MTHVIPVGTSEPQDFQLRDDGSAYVGTGITVTLEIANRSGAVIATPPTVAWVSAAAGTVRVSGVEHLAVGTYYVRYVLTDSGGDVGYIPNGRSPDIWAVVERKSGDA